MNRIVETYQKHGQVFLETERLLPEIDRIANLIVSKIEKDATIFFMGNGGSAADSQHLAAELIGRFEKERRSIPAMALSTDTSILTSLSNDYGYEIIFARQLQAWCKPKDVVIGLSTSGNSPNVLQGIKVANQMGALTIGLSGSNGGKLASLAKENLIIPSDCTARIQEMHILIGHILCDVIEQAVYTKEIKTEYAVV